ncbi:MAG: hypothetical protein GY757_23795 [bacterium]|nr:hypothetical protein [bacterium]
MNHTDNLDNVIRSLKNPGDMKTGRDDGRNIRIDTVKGEILVNRSILTFRRRNIKYYFVSSRARAEGSCECSIRDFATDCTITLLLKYEVKCGAGQEEKVVKALYKKASPLEALNESIRIQVKDFAADIRKAGGNPVLDYYKYRTKLETYLENKIINETGLENNFVLSLKNEDLLKIYKIESDFFKVRVKDCDDELNLKFKTALDIAPQYRIHAVLNYARWAELENLVREFIGEFILREAKLHDYVYLLDTTLRERIIEALNKELELKGRRIAWLNMEADAPDSFPEESITNRHSTFCDIKDSSQKIEIRHKLLMQLKNIGKFKAARIEGDLEKTVEEKLDAITKSVLFDKEYVKILLDFDKVETEREILNTIRDGMEDYLESIGYTVKHHIVDPNAKPLILKRDGFSVEVKETEYSTLDSRVKIKLKIAARGKLKNLENISRYITPERDIEEEMRKLLEDEMKREMHYVDPEEFYMSAGSKEIESVPERLTGILKNKLEEVFCTDKVIVAVSTAETDLINRVEDFKTGSPYRFEIEVFPQREAGRQERVYFELEFLIKGVAEKGWHAFLSRKREAIKAEVDKIVETLSRDICARFQKIPAGILLAGDIKQSKKLLEIARYSQAKIAGILGIDILITLLNRKETKLETTHLDILNKQIEGQKEKELAMLVMQDNADKSNLKILLDRRAEMLHPDCFDADELAEIDEQIETLTDKSAFVVGEGQKRLQSAAPEPAENFDIDAYADAMKNEIPALGVKPPKAIPEESKETAGS